MLRFGCAMLLAALSICDGSSDPQFDMKCRLPDYYSPVHPKMSTRKFSVYSDPSPGLGGIGNILTYWPVAWIQAAVTGYDMVIVDDSMIGKMCKVIKCGHPMMSEVEKNHSYVTHPPATYKFGDTMRAITGSRVVSEDVVYVHGFMSHQSASMYTKQIRTCLEGLTGCPFDDALCMEHYAFMSLVKGPFLPAAVKSLLSRVEGLPRHLLHHILNEPLGKLPRLDGAFQLRMQYAEMETIRARDASKSFFATEDGRVFAKTSMQELHQYLTGATSPHLKRHFNRSKPYIFISCDDSIDKMGLVEILRNASGFLPQGAEINVSPVFVRNIANLSHTKSYAHVKNELFEHSVAYYSFVDTVFDCTFSESACRVCDRDVCDYSVYHKLRVMTGPREKGYKHVWQLSHPETGNNVSCQVPPHFVHALENQHHQAAKGPAA